MNTKNIRLYLISGFLGAGKTTLLKRILEKRPETKTGIIMNEFGKISIDGPILERPGMEMIELTRGSIFCSCLKLSFADALIQMSARDLDCVIVESSGLADPSNIGEILEAVAPYAAVPYQYSGCINVVDACHFLSQLESLETVAKQVETADLVIINKLDRVKAETAVAVRNAVAGIHGSVRILESIRFDMDFGFMDEPLFVGETIRNEVSHNNPENKPKTFSLGFEHPVPREAFTVFLTRIAPSAFRVKGFVNLAEGPHQVDVVGSLIDYVPHEKDYPKSMVVFISRVGPLLIREVNDAWLSLFRDIPFKMSN